MACSSVSYLCNNIVLSQAVTFTAAAGTTPATLAIDLPAGSYANCEKYCIVIAQEIPAATTINANVVITIGGDATVTYPLVNCNGTNVQAAALTTRTRYATRVATNVGSGVFKLLSNINCNNCRCNTGSPALPITTATPEAASLNPVSLVATSSEKPVKITTTGGKN